MSDPYYEGRPHVPPPEPFLPANNRGVMVLVLPILLVLLIVLAFIIW